MTKYPIDKLRPMGHTSNIEVRERTIEYLVTNSGKTPAKEWLNSIKDKTTLAILYKRIRQSGLGNFGKVRSVGKGVLELKIDYGPGYRIYFSIYKDSIILLLLGGNKKTQKRDIVKAHNYWSLWMENRHE